MQNLHMTVQNEATDKNPNPSVFKLAGVPKEQGTEWQFEKKERTAEDDGIKHSWGRFSHHRFYRLCLQVVKHIKVSRGGFFTS